MEVTSGQDVNRPGPPKFPFTVTPTILIPTIKAVFRLRASACISIFYWSARSYFEVRGWARGGKYTARSPRIQAELVDLVWGTANADFTHPKVY